MANKAVAGIALIILLSACCLLVACAEVKYMVTTLISGVATDGRMAQTENGDLYFSNRGNNYISKVSTTGILTQVIGTGSTSLTIDGILANVTNVASPQGLSISPKGDIYFAELSNNRVRVMFSNKTVITIAGTVTGSYGSGADNIAATSSPIKAPAEAVYFNGEVFFSDTSNYKIKKVDRNGIISTIVGDGTPGFKDGAGTSATIGMYGAYGLHITSNGDIYFADLANNRIRKYINATKTVTTIVGQSTSGKLDGSVSVATLSAPDGVTVASNGDIIFSDRDNHAIRKISASTNNVTTIAGTIGTFGNGTDNIVATSSALQNPSGVLVNSQGKIYVLDNTNKRVRVLIPFCESYDYYLSSDGLQCIDRICNGLKGDLGCGGSSKGSCNGTSCTCQFGWTGNNCSTAICYGLTGSIACSGIGSCVAPNNCSCPSFYTSSFCNVSTGAVALKSSQPEIYTYADGKYYAPALTLTDPYFGNLVLNSGLNFTWTCSSNGNSWYTTSSENVDLSRCGYTSGSNISVSVSVFNGIYPRRTSATIYLTLKIMQVTLSSFRIPTYLVDQTTYEFDAVFSSIQFINNYPSSILPCSNLTCSQSLTYKIYRTTSDNTFDFAGSGVAIGTYSSSSISLNPPINYGESLKISASSMSAFKLAILFENGNEKLTFNYSVPVISKPQPNGQSLISPLNGTSIHTIFTINVQTWNTTYTELTPFQYAVGFKLKQQSLSVRLTDYSTNLTIPTVLPFTNLQNALFIDQVQSAESVDVLLYVKDALSNEYISTISSVSIDLNRIDDVSDILKSINGSNNFAVASSYDYSIILRNDSINEYSKAIISKLDLNVDKPSQALYSINMISSLTTLNSVATSIRDKLDTYLNQVITKYETDKSTNGFVTEKQTSKDLTSTLASISNLLAKGFVQDMDIVCELLSNVQLAGEVATLLVDESSLPSKQLISNAVNITIINIIKQSASSFSFSQDNVKVNSDYIMSKYDTFSKEVGYKIISYNKLIKEANTNETSLSSLTDFKVSQNGTDLKLRNLEKPISLTFKSSSNISNSSLISCKYWDEDESSWKSDGCKVVSYNSQTNEIECSCNHTTLFSAFLEYNTSSLSTDIAQQLTTLYTAQIVMGAIYLVTSITILILLIVFREKQPIKSRLATPFIGMIAMIIQSAMLSITQKGVLLSSVNSKLISTQSSVAKWEGTDLTANIIGNIFMIIVNTLTLTAITTYLYQVIRFQVLKYLYHQLIMLKKNVTPEYSKSYDTFLHFLKKSLSTTFLIILLSVVVVSNICYWTLFVLLNRCGVIQGATYTYIVSISYTVMIILCGMAICGVFIVDVVMTIINERKKKQGLTVQLQAQNKSAKDLKQKKPLATVILKSAPVYSWFVKVDFPLYFRAEMVLFAVSFTFLVLNQIIGLYSLMYENSSNMITYDSVSFVFEILYVLSYFFVYGGYALCVLFVHKIKQHYLGKQQAKKEENDDKQVGDTDFRKLLESKEGMQLLEDFAEKEFSLENVQLYSDLKYYFENHLENNQKDSLLEFFNDINNTYIKAASLREVNISSTCRKEFIRLHQILQTASSVEASLKKELDAVLDQLMESALVNMSDTFSRLVLTDSYESYSSINNGTTELMQKANLVQ